MQNAAQNLKKNAVSLFSTEVELPIDNPYKLKIIIIITTVATSTLYVWVE